LFWLKVCRDAPDAADQGRDAEKQQCRADDRAGDLRLDDPGMRPREDEEGQYQFGGVAEADIEQPADGAAGVLCKLIGGAAKPIGEHSDGGGTGEEDPAGRRVEEVAQRQG
jgi:hypothetical protein